MLAQANQQIRFGFRFAKTTGTAVAGVTGLTVTASVYDLASGTPATPVATGQACVEVAHGVYRLSYTPSVAGDYLAVAACSNSSLVDDNAVCAYWSVGQAWVERINANVDSRLAAAAYTAPPSASTVGAAVWADATGVTVVSRLDVAVGTRLAAAAYTAPPSAVANADATWTHIAGATLVGRVDVAVSTRAEEAGGHFRAGTVVVAGSHSLTIATGGYQLRYGDALAMIDGDAVGQTNYVFDHNISTGQVRCLAPWTLTPQPGDRWAATRNLTTCAPWRAGYVVEATTSVITIEPGGHEIPEGAAIEFHSGAAGEVYGVVHSHDVDTGEVTLKGALPVAPEPATCYAIFARSEWRVTGAPDVLDAVPFTEPALPTSGWGLASWLAWGVRALAKRTLSSTELIVHRRDGTEWTTQTVTDAGTQTVGELS